VIFSPCYRRHSAARPLHECWLLNAQREPALDATVRALAEYGFEVGDRYLLYDLYAETL
jgi:hypothetical protein